MDQDAAGYRDATFCKLRVDRINRQGQAVLRHELRQRAQQFSESARGDGMECAAVQVTEVRQAERNDPEAELGVVACFGEDRDNGIGCRVVGVQNAIERVKLSFDFLLHAS